MQPYATLASQRAAVGSVSFDSAPPEFLEPRIAAHTHSQADMIPTSQRTAS